MKAIEMYGFGNWAEVSDYVGSKSKSQCIDHYNAVYMSSPCFPLPVSIYTATPCLFNLTIIFCFYEVTELFYLTYSGLDSCYG